jgi:hypothetical protein
MHAGPSRVLALAGRRQPALTVLATIREIGLPHDADRQKT